MWHSSQSPKLKKSLKNTKTPLKFNNILPPKLPSTTTTKNKNKSKSICLLNSSYQKEIKNYYSQIDQQQKQSKYSYKNLKELSYQLQKQSEETQATAAEISPTYPTFQQPKTIPRSLTSHQHQYNNKAFSPLKFSRSINKSEIEIQNNFQIPKNQNSKTKLSKSQKQQRATQINFENYDLNINNNTQNLSEQSILTNNNNQKVYQVSRKYIPYNSQNVSQLLPDKEETTMNQQNYNHKLQNYKSRIRSSTTQHKPAFIKREELEDNDQEYKNQYLENYKAFNPNIRNKNYKTQQCQRNQQKILGRSSSQVSEKKQEEFNRFYEKMRQKMKHKPEDSQDCLIPSKKLQHVLNELHDKSEANQEDYKLFLHNNIEQNQQYKEKYHDITSSQINLNKKLDYPEKNQVKTHKNLLSTLLNQALIREKINLKTHQKPKVNLEYQYQQQFMKSYNNYYQIYPQQQQNQNSIQQQQETIQYQSNNKLQYQQQQYMENLLLKKDKNFEQLMQISQKKQNNVYRQNQNQNQEQQKMVQQQNTKDILRNPSVKVNYQAFEKSLKDPLEKYVEPIFYQQNC